MDDMTSEQTSTPPKDLLLTRRYEKAMLLGAWQDACRDRYAGRESRVHHYPTAQSKAYQNGWDAADKRLSERSAS